MQCKMVRQKCHEEKVRHNIRIVKMDATLWNYDAPKAKTTIACITRPY